MSDDLEPVFGRKPPCPSCGSRCTVDHGTAARATVQRRRCQACAATFKVPALVFVRYVAKGRPIVVPNV